MENNNLLANYIVKRLENLEIEVEQLKEEREVLRRELAKVEEMKKTMRKYFSRESYTDGGKYIDHSYQREFVAEIAEFIGLTEGEEDVDE